MTREMGPMMMGIILAGRVGSSLAAEVGTMKVSEEIDALETMSIDPVKFLVFPRLMALMIMGPVLAIYCMGMGVLGGAVVAKYMIGVDYDAYWFWADQSLTLSDVVQGIVKGFAFAIEIAIIGCMSGLSASGGAEGVGRQTRNAVVICLMIIIASNFVMSSLFSRL
jgi:phospholipid/cholesterol/gamma-HCH transport system permease protein